MAVVVCLVSNADAASVLQLKPIISLSEMYNDNILFAPSNTKGDFVTSALLGADADLGTPTSDTEVEYSALAQKFTHYSQYDSVGASQYLTLRHQEELSPDTAITATDFFLRGNLTSGFTPGGSIAFNPGLGQSALQGSGYWTNSVSGSLSHDFGDGLDSTLSVMQTTFHSNGIGYSFQQGANAGLQYWLLPTLSTGVQYQFYDFRFSAAPPAETHWPQLSLNWEPTARINAYASAGPAFRHTFGGSTVVNPGYELGIGYSGEKWMAHVGGGETPSLAAGLGGAGESRAASGSFSYALGRYTSFLADVSYQDYSGGGFNGDVFGYGVEIQSQFTQWLTLYAQYGGSRRSFNRGSPLASRAIGLPVGTGAVDNIYMIGAAISFDLFKSVI